MRGFIVVRLDNTETKHANTVAQPGRTRARPYFTKIFLCLTRDAPLYCCSGARRTALSDTLMER